MHARRDRTGRFVEGLVKNPDGFFSLPVPITAEPAALETANGAQTLETLVGLVSRFRQPVRAAAPIARRPGARHGR